MYTKQNNFEYRGKPNKQLACVLVEVKEKWSILDMFMKEGIRVNSLEDKLNIFECYRSSEPIEVDTEIFLDKVVTPKFIVDLKQNCCYL